MLTRPEHSRPMSTDQGQTIKAKTTIPRPRPDYFQAKALATKFGIKAQALQQFMCGFCVIIGWLIAWLTDPLDVSWFVTGNVWISHIVFSHTLSTTLQWLKKCRALCCWQWRSISQLPWLLIFCFFIVCFLQGWEHQVFVNKPNRLGLFWGEGFGFFGFSKAQLKP